MSENYLRNTLRADPTVDEAGIAEPSEIQSSFRNGLNECDRGSSSSNPHVFIATEAVKSAKDALDASLQLHANSLHDLRFVCRDYIERADDEVSELKAQNQDSQRQIAQLKQEVERLRSNNATHVQDYEQLNLRHISLSSRNAHLKEKGYDYRCRVFEVEAEVEDLRSDEVSLTRKLELRTQKYTLLMEEYQKLACQWFDAIHSPAEAPEPNEKAYSVARSCGKKPPSCSSYEISTAQRVRSTSPGYDAKAPLESDDTQSESSHTGSFWLLNTIPNTKQTREEPEGGEDDFYDNGTQDRGRYDTEQMTSNQAGADTRSTDDSTTLERTKPNSRTHKGGGCDEIGGMRSVIRQKSAWNHQASKDSTSEFDRQASRQRLR